MKDHPKAIRFDLTAQEFARAMAELLREQAASNPVYRRYLQTLGFSPSPATDWTDFPPLPAEAFKLPEAVSCFAPSQAHTVFETSGTTGAETGLHYFKNTSLYEHALETSFLHFMPDLHRHRWISLIPPATTLPRSSLSHMLSHLAGRLPSEPVRWLMDGNFHRDHAGWEEALTAAKKENNPVALFSTVFALVQALDQAAHDNQSWPLPPGSMLFLTGGTKGRVREIAMETLARLIQERLGLGNDAVVFEYGMTELSSQGYAQGFGSPYIFPPWTRVLARDPVTGGLCPPGEIGILEFYDLANTGSIAALRTRDAGQVFTPPEEPFPRILLLGRASAAPARGCSLPYES